jgi:hypothetical protein
MTKPTVQALFGGPDWRMDAQRRAYAKAGIKPRKFAPTKPKGATK